MGLILNSTDGLVKEYLLTFDINSVLKPFLNLHVTLPFSNAQFFLFLIFSVIAGFLFRKKYLNSSKAYLNFLTIVSSCYILLLYTKPIHFVSFVFYGYIIFSQLSQKRNWKGIKIVLLYVLPLFFMKLFNVLPEFKLNIHSFFQIAGLSYATFKMLQIHFDEADTSNISLKAYFTFLAFPPTLLIGPIDRFDRFTKNVNLGFSTINSENFNKGFNFLIKGLLFKYILATAINQLIIKHLDGFDGFLFHLSYMYSYLFYLFFDFAGYSLLAMAFGYFLGIQVPFNFDKPFLAKNPKEFWHHWHKSLGDWLNDYFFKPIFKTLTSNKVFNSIQRQGLALFLTFTLMGFWNGFELHFIVSGMLFGCYSVIHNYYSYQCKKNGRDVLFGGMNSTFVKYLSIFILFNSVAFSIYIFSGKLF
jgi:membrane protein involved in D-alanine export